jgi:hypothetical protein
VVYNFSFQHLQKQKSHQKVTHHSQTKHSTKSEQAIMDTLHTMNKMKIQLHLQSEQQRSWLKSLRTDDNTENTGRLIRSQRVHWHANCCLAMS